MKKGLIKKIFSTGILLLNLTQPVLAENKDSIFLSGGAFTSNEQEIHENYGPFFGYDVGFQTKISDNFRFLTSLSSYEAKKTIEGVERTLNFQNFGLTLQAKRSSSDLFSLYSGIGLDLLLLKGTNISQNDSYTTRDVSWGMHSCLGADFDFGEYLDFFVELSHSYNFILGSDAGRTALSLGYKLDF